MPTELISKIQDIISEHGEFSTYDVEADHSPSVPSRGNFIHLIEDFLLNYCNVRVYKSGGDQEEDEYEISYEELEVETLEYILELAEKWKEMVISNMEN